MDWDNADTTLDPVSPFVAPEATMVMFGTAVNGETAFSVTLRSFHEPSMAANAAAVDQWLALVATLAAKGFRVISR